MGLLVVLFLPTLAASLAASSLSWVVLLESIYLGLGVVTLGTTAVLPAVALQLCYVGLVVGAVDLVLLLAVACCPPVARPNLY